MSIELPGSGHSDRLQWVKSSLSLTRVLARSRIIIPPESGHETVSGTDTGSEERVGELTSALDVVFTVGRLEQLEHQQPEQHVPQGAAADAGRSAEHREADEVHFLSGGCEGTRESEDDHANPVQSCGRCTGPPAGERVCRNALCAAGRLDRVSDGYADRQTAHGLPSKKSGPGGGVASAGPLRLSCPRTPHGTLEALILYGAGRFGTSGSRHATGRAMASTAVWSRAPTAALASS